MGHHFKHTVFFLALGCLGFSWQGIDYYVKQDTWAILGLQYMVIGLHFIQGLGERHVFIKGQRL